MSVLVEGLDISPKTTQRNIWFEDILLKGASCITSWRKLNWGWQIDYKAYYRPQMKLREGYVFTGVCDSVNRGVCMVGGMCGCWGECMVVRGHARMWGLCVVVGGMHGCRGVWLQGTCMLQGACVVGISVGRLFFWQFSWQGYIFLQTNVSYRSMELKMIWSIGLLLLWKLVLFLLIVWLIRWISWIQLKAMKHDWRLHKVSD